MWSIEEASRSLLSSVFFHHWEPQERENDLMASSYYCSISSSFSLMHSNDNSSTFFHGFFLSFEDHVVTSTFLDQLLKYTAHYVYSSKLKCTIVYTLVDPWSSSPSCTFTSSFFSSESIYILSSCSTRASVFFLLYLNLDFNFLRDSCNFFSHIPLFDRLYSKMFTDTSSVYAAQVLFDTTLTYIFDRSSLKIQYSFLSASNPIIDDFMDSFHSWSLSFSIFS